MVVRRERAEAAKKAAQETKRREWAARGPLYVQLCRHGHPLGAPCAECQAAIVVEKERKMITPEEWKALSAVEMLKRLREEGARSCVTQKEIAAAICKCASLCALDRYDIAIVEEVTAWAEERKVNWLRLSNVYGMLGGGLFFIRQIADDKISVANAADFAWEAAKQILVAQRAPRVQGETVTVTDAQMRPFIEPLWSEDKMLGAMDQEEARLYLLGPEGRGGRLDTCAAEDRERLEEWACRLDDPEAWAVAERSATA